MHSALTYLLYSDTRICVEYDVKPFAYTENQKYAQNVWCSRRSVAYYG